MAGCWLLVAGCWRNVSAVIQRTVPLTVILRSFPSRCHPEERSDEGSACPPTVILRSEATKDLLFTNAVCNSVTQKQIPRFARNDRLFASLGMTGGSLRSE